MSRISIDAVIMGLMIGLGAVLLEAWVGNASWLFRIAALLAIGLVLCVVQYFLLLRRRER